MRLALKKEQALDRCCLGQGGTGEMSFALGKLRGKAFVEDLVLERFVGSRGEEMVWIPGVEVPDRRPLHTGEWRPGRDLNP